ncbi:MAG: F0F1 ATP synthase subunit epsilon [bacterium]
MSDLYLEIVTPNKKVFSGQVKSIVAPGTEGYFGVLPRHAPLLASLAVGIVRAKVEDRNEQKEFAASEGFLEVSPQKVTVIAEAAEESRDIDVQRAEAAKDRALKRISEGRENWNVSRAQAALLRALNRLRLAGKS